MNIFERFGKKAAIGVAALGGGIYACLQDPAVLALIPGPWGMVVGKFVAGLTLGGVGYSMVPRQDGPSGISSPKE